MATKTRFSAADSLGSLDHFQIEEYLREIGNDASANELLHTGVTGQGVSFLSKAYNKTGLSIGYVAPDASMENLAGIVGATSLTADDQLVGSRIKITLDKFYVHAYPGLGEHRVLCEFAGKNQVSDDVGEEELRFALQTTVRDNESASISGHPIFVGVTVGKDGISFEGRTINIGSSTDDVILQTLESSAFKGGLSLLTTVQPALKPFAGLSASVVKATLERKKNKQIHNFNIGLDFGSNATSARLCVGSYVAAQTDGGRWDWSAYAWDRESMTIVDRDKPCKPVTLNYIVFGISKFSDPA